QGPTIGGLGLDPPAGPGPGGSWAAPAPPRAERPVDSTRRVRWAFDEPRHSGRWLRLAQACLAWRVLCRRGPVPRPRRRAAQASGAREDPGSIRITDEDEAGPVVRMGEGVAFGGRDGPLPALASRDSVQGAQRLRAGEPAQPGLGFPERLGLRERSVQS